MNIHLLKEGIPRNSRMVKYTEWYEGRGHSSHVLSGGIFPEPLSATEKVVL
jgi:hypothetical protein